MWDFGPTKTVLLTFMSLPSSFFTDPGDTNHDLIASDISGIDVFSPQPRLFDAGQTSTKMKRQDDSTRIKLNSMKSDEDLDEKIDEQIMLYDETKNMDFASNFGFLTI